jgi:type I restriction enzyme M protein
LFTAELTTQVDAIWRAFAQTGITDPVEVVDQITRVLADRTRPDRADIRSESPPNTLPAHLLSELSELLDSPLLQAPATMERFYDHLTGKLGAHITAVVTPSHIVRLMVALAEPTPEDTIIDPAVGTAGLLVAAAEYLREHHPRVGRDGGPRDHINNEAFTGVESDASLSRIATTNLRLHGVQNATIVNRDSLAEPSDGHGSEASNPDLFSLVLANPPLSGSRDLASTSRHLLSVVKTKKTEQLFLAHVLGLLSPGGRAVVVVPDSMLFGMSKTHKDLRRMLVEDHNLEAIVRLPAGVFRPHSAASASIVLVRKSGATDRVWFYDVRADGVTPDAKGALTDANDLPDAIARWRSLSGLSAPGAEVAEAGRPRTAQSFLVPRAELASHDYDLTFSRYRIAFAEHIMHRTPNDILIEIARLELQIQQAAAALARSLGEPQ